MHPNSDSSHGIMVDLERKMKEIITFAKDFYDSNDDLHGLGHINRVLVHSKKIWRKEGGEWPIIESIIWLHDIGRNQEKKFAENHAILSEKLAKPYLIRLGLNQDLISQISHGIISHSYSVGIKPRSIEAKIVSDADKIDALGAVGIFRVCAFQANNEEGIKEVIAHYYDKLEILQNQLYLDASIEIGIERTEILKNFIENLKNEVTIK